MNVRGVNPTAAHENAWQDRETNCGLDGIHPANETSECAHAFGRLSTLFHARQGILKDQWLIGGLKQNRSGTGLPF
jgi:hypothetical protein